MKELSIEQKAKAYDEALKVLKEKFSDKEVCGLDKSVLQKLFPQLKESKDERTWIINYLSNRILNSTIIAEKENLKNAIAWLEKQGKNNMGISEATKQKLEDNLNKALEKETPESCNKFLEKQGEQKPAKNKGMNLKEEEMTPFQKEVFYIIDTTIEAEVGLKQECDILLALASNEIKQKPTAWSEEDEKNLLEINCLIGNYRTGDDEYKLESWLESIKDRVQPKQEWSEEDEKMRTRLAACLGYHYHDGMMTRKEYEEAHNWLKNLRPQKQWKPSDEQMLALADAIETYCGKYKATLTSFYNVLKKLTE